ncbi:MAG: hypothetical protein ACD_80C00048G0003 [uncultured bacterium (gcode 4)]|uniref:Uncharacterized protein n=1 Tax=uncultured bacterium (gcode 4) TaxID=1234023 RepID=K1XYM2_9BACT|nr:MAG: hypothetical protein ACD_80C00048G0003 [uncultured bacterium (gcode 4)]HBB04301.1 hypothetical protein [Candidatus Gracilibacteria bacterium]
MEKSKRDPREPLCPGGIIQGNPILEAVLNPDPKNARVFFSHKKINEHCSNICKEQQKCSEEHKKTILDLFRSYNKPVIES